MKKWVSLFFALLVFSPSVLADFSHIATGVIRYPTGLERPLEFELSFKNRQFSVGKMKIETDSVPEKYALGLIVHKEKYMVVQEFVNGYFSEFDMQIADHKIKLSKRKFKSSVKGDYVLNIDGIDYFFSSSIAQIEFSLTDDGIQGVEVQGLVKDIGSKQ